LCLRLPSDSISRWTPLPSANGWRLQTPIVDFHHQVNYHARHTITKPGRLMPGFFFAYTLLTNKKCVDTLRWKNNSPLIPNTSFRTSMQIVL
ncbi:MAG: hypothetical protein PHX54_12040, partial [Lentimicrobiaceae bacterium]|nr:hypothetical protein [Lentimicrobiaceae bacterium]